MRLKVLVACLLAWSTGRVEGRKEEGWKKMVMGSSADPHSSLPRLRSDPQIARLVWFVGVFA